MRATRITVLVLITASLAACAAAMRSPFERMVPAEVEFSREGGIAGEQATLVVAPDGAYELQRRGQPLYGGRLPEQVVSRLRGLVARVDWPNVERSYLGPDAADVYTYSLMVTADGQTVATAATDASLPRAPEDVQALLAYLDGLLGQLAR